jgi:hypothetical protein
MQIRADELVVPLWGATVTQMPRELTDIIREAMQRHSKLGTKELFFSLHVELSLTRRQRCWKTMKDLAS